MGNVQLSKLPAPARRVKLGKIFLNIILLVSISSSCGHHPLFPFSSTQTVAKPTLLFVSEKSSTMAVYTTHQVGSHLVARVSVEYHATSSARVSTSNPSPGKYGRATQVTDKEGVMKIVQLVLLRLPPVI